MADELRVSPEELQRAGDQLDRHGQTLAAVQQRSHDEAQSAQAGWVGSSAGALAGLLDGWTAVGRLQIQRINEQAGALRDAAAALAAFDRGGAISLGTPPAAGEIR